MAGLPKAAALFDETFTRIDWCVYSPGMGGSWPPGPGGSGPQVPGRWLRMMPEGWPSNSGAQDASARNQGGSKDNQCYEEFRTALAPCGLVMVADNTTPGIEFPQFPAQSGMAFLNPNQALGFGYYEAQMFIPPGPGYNRAFCLYTADTSAGWPFELDPFQFIGLDENGKPSNQDFFLSVTNDNGQDTSCTWISGKSCVGWHNLGMLVAKDACLFTFDNAQVFAAPTPAKLAALSEPQLCPAFQLAVGAPGSWQGTPPSSEVGVTMGVRHFRFHPQGSWSGGTFPKMLGLPAGA